MKNRMNQLKLVTPVVAVLALLGTARGDDKKAGDKPYGPGEIFAAIDADGDGSITVKELGDSRRFADASQEKIDAAFKEKDLDGDGAISEHEFTKSFGANKDKGKGKHGKGKKGKTKGKGKGGPGKGGKGGD